jgi:uncharacterized protein (DUF983 family)
MPDQGDQPAQIFDGQFPIGKSARFNAWEEYRRGYPPGQRWPKINFMQRANVSALKAILHQLCPRCRAGTIFRKSVFLFPAMRERCPVCDLKFEREEGYFLGAMYIGYALALAMIAVFGVLLWSFAVAVSENYNRRGAVVLALRAGPYSHGASALDLSRPDH